MDARVAAVVVGVAAIDTAGTANQVTRSFVARGFPFHPPSRPSTLRADVLLSLPCPGLVVQGERDPFGQPAAIESYSLLSALKIHGIPGGDHDLKPRRKDGRVWHDCLDEAAAQIAEFARSL